MANRLWILGASDPEMAAIERLLREAGEVVIHAMVGGRRVHPGNAYSAAAAAAKYGNDSGETIYFVECAGQVYGTSQNAVVIDHHRPGDPGYGRPPEEYWPSSSIGQVVHALARLGIRPAEYPDDYTAIGGRGVPSKYLMTAAADHCLEAAYRGRCPGVDPDALMQWRAESRAAFQGRTVEAVMADIETARQRLRLAVSPQANILDDYADLRGESIPELPEAAAREGIPFVASQTDRDGRRKVVLMSAPPELVSRFLTGEIVPGLVDCYGDPARGFAGGYE